MDKLVGMLARKEGFLLSILQGRWFVCWLYLGGRHYGMVATSLGPSNTLFKFQLINSKHKIIKI
jgi:hypothetical protein